MEQRSPISWISSTEFRKLSQGIRYVDLTQDKPLPSVQHVQSTIEVVPSNYGDGNSKVKLVLQKPDDSCALHDTPEKIAEFDALMRKVRITTKLLPHQRDGITWMTKVEGRTKNERQRACGSILADDMGLGKTLQAIALSLTGRYLDSIYNQGKPMTPTLIICPVQLIQTWENQISSSTTLQPYEIHRFYEDGREINSATLMKKIFVITNYETVRGYFRRICNEKKEVTTSLGQRGVLFDTQWDRIILDEAQTIKAALKITSRAVCALRSNRRFCLTGTPVNNDVKDIWALCKFINVGRYANIEFWNNATEEDLKEWRSKMFLQRTKAVLGLPPLQRQDILVELGEREAELYYELALEAEVDYGKYLQGLNEEGESKKVTYRDVLVWLLNLHQVSCDPTLLMGREATCIYSKTTMQNGAMKFTDFCTRCDASLTAESQQPSASENNESSSNGKNKRKRNPKKVEGLHYFRLHCGHIVCTACGKNVQCTLCRYQLKWKDASAEPLQENLSSSNNNNSTQPKAKEEESYKVIKVVSTRGLVDRIVKIPKNEESSQSTPTKKGKKGLNIPVCSMSSRTKKLIQYLQEKFRENPKSKKIIFSQWAGYLDLIENAINNYLRVHYVRIDGGVSDIRKRDGLLEDFQNDPNCRLLVVTTRIGGVGLNLTCADEVISMDLPYNPAVGSQAENRIHRIGQTMEVVSTRIYCNLSIDLGIKEIQDQKIETANVITGKDALKAGDSLSKNQIHHIISGLTQARKVREHIKQVSKEKAANPLVPGVPDVVDADVEIL